jgi:uncharacterized phage infection (PIP) family protein YhgE
MTQANPELWQVIGDLLVENMDWPGAEGMAKRLKMTLLPQVQQIANEDDGEPEIPPQVAAQMEQMQQQMQQMQEAGSQLQTDLQATQQKLEKETTSRLKAEITAQEAQAMLRISEAEQAALDNIEREREAQETGPTSVGSSTSGAGKQPAQQSPVVVVDTVGGGAAQLAPMINQIAEQANASMEAVASLAAQQESIMAAVTQMSAPKPPASVRMMRQEDGSYIAQKIEGDQVNTVHMVKQPDGSFAGGAV